MYILSMLYTYIYIYIYIYIYSLKNYSWVGVCAHVYTLLFYKKNFDKKMSLHNSKTF